MIGLYEVWTKRFPWKNSFVSFIWARVMSTNLFPYMHSEQPFKIYLPTWQPLHLLVLGQIPDENKRIKNQPPKVLAAGYSPKKKERDTVFKGAFTTYSRKVSLNQ